MTYGEDQEAPADARSAGVASTARPGRRIADHAQIARQLATRPYEWGTVAVYRAAYVAVSTAGFIRAASGTFRVYGPAGSFETRATPVEDGTLLEARYVRGIARPLPGLIVGLLCTERDDAGQRESTPSTGIATVWPGALNLLAGDKTTLEAGEWDGSAQLEKAATAWDAEE